MATAKILSNDNLHKMINLLMSIKSESAEQIDKCISVWTADTTYKKDSVVLVLEGNQYSEYCCDTTHISKATFEEDKTYWTLVSCVDFEGYTEEELLEMLNLTQEELQNLQSILRDEEISVNSAWSSSKVYAELLTVLSESKNFTIAEVAKIVSFSYKVVASEDDVIDDKAIYLIENASGTHDMYLLIDGSPSKVGNTSIDLSDYLKKENIVDTFDETTIYTDSDKVFSTKATKEALDTKLNKSAIATTLNSSCTDEQVASALATYNAIKDWSSVYSWDYVNSTSLNVNLAKAGLYKFSTITEGAPSDNPGDYTLLNIPWNKNSDSIRYGMQLLFSPRVQHFYFRRIWGYNPDTYVYTEGDYSVFGKWNVCGHANPYTLGYEPSSLIIQIPENGDLNNYTTAGVYICKSYSIGATLSNAPNKTKNHAFKLEVNCTANGICQQRILALNNSADIFEFSRTYSTAGTWSAWKKVCYTSIEDIEVTSLVPADTTNYYNSDVASTIQSSHYCVKNGICTMNIGLTCTTPSTSFVTLFSGLPKPKAKYTFRALSYDSTNGMTQVNININTNGMFLINGGKAGCAWYTATISYPVKE